ncbi:hypothetical protein [Saccharopolyspora shandongensis]|uniref:hypothetical protein n=1 Tax=Saccharopolyspora shandongensis TaxID=418495 RepID=UPI0033C4E983
MHFAGRSTRPSKYRAGSQKFAATKWEQVVPARFRQPRRIVGRSTSVRYTGASVGYQLAGIVGGSLTPIVGVSLLAATGSVLPVAAFVLAMLALTLISMVVAGETRHRRLTGI